MPTYSVAKGEHQHEPTDLLGIPSNIAPGALYSARVLFLDENGTPEWRSLLVANGIVLEASGPGYVTLTVDPENVQLTSDQVVVPDADYLTNADPNSISTLDVVIINLVNRITQLEAQVAALGGGGG